MAESWRLIWIFVLGFGLAVVAVDSFGREMPGTSPETEALSSCVATVAGAISGSFAAQQGVATYSMSLAVPPGTRGTQPSLALAYSSAQGNGALGVGFRLQGVSAISRCGTQIVSDNVKGGVFYDDGDAFCLNGQRLIDIGNGEYRTQKESRQRIVRFGTCGNGPCSFTLSRHDGTVTTFGLLDAKNGSRVLVEERAPEHGAKSVRVWMQDELVDRNGNTVSLFYTQKPSLATGGTSDQSRSGQTYLAKIFYASAQGPEDSRAIEFRYDDQRTDTLLEYIGGGLVETALRLAQIETSIRPASATCGGTTCPSQSVMTYDLDYTPAPTTGRSRLTSVTQRSASEDCLLPTTFAWTDGGNSLQKSPVKADFSQSKQSYVGDFNGDGLSDILVNTDEVQKLYYATPAGGFGRGHGTCIDDALKDFIFGDFNSDGKTDLYASPGVGYNDGMLYLGGSPRFGCKCSKDPLYPCTPVKIEGTPNLLGGDFNGDGRTDLLAAEADNSVIYLSQGDNTFSPSTSQDYGPPDEGSALYTADFNGDGRADVLAIEEDGGHGSLYYASGTGDDASLNEPVHLIDDLSGDFRWVSDFNNDGITDLMVGNGDMAHGAVTSHIFYGTGKRLAKGQGLTTLLTENNHLGDFNGDGLPDIFVVDGGDSKLYLGNGTTFDCIGSHGLCIPMAPDIEAGSSFLGDFNGDGLTDIFTARGLDSVFDWAAKNGTVADKNPAADMLESIVDGYGGKTEISYKPITDASVYRASGNSAATGISNLYASTPLAPTLVRTYPVQTLRLGQLVVADYVQRNDPRINSKPYHYEYSYFYERGLLNLMGRGWMGYRTVTETDSQLAARVTTTYSQTFPTNGKILARDTCRTPTTNICTSRSGVARLRSTSASWSCTDSQQPPAACVVDNTGYDGTATQVFYVEPESTTTEDLVLGSKVETTFEFDDWGNLEQVSELGDQNDPGSQPLYTCTSYFEPDAKRWIFGYPQYRKKTTRSDCTSDISTWHPGTKDPGTRDPGTREPSDRGQRKPGDLRLLQYAYDDDWNRTQRLAWDDQNDIWLGVHLDFYTQGLPRSVTEMSGQTPEDVPGTTYMATYDEGFSSYVASVTTPDPGSGAGPLTLNFAHDARYGVTVAKQDAAGNIINACVDGFGRASAQQGPIEGRPNRLTERPKRSSNCVGDATYPYVDATFTGNTDLVTTAMTSYQHDRELASLRVVRSGASSWHDEPWGDGVTRIVDGLGRTVEVTYQNDLAETQRKQTVYLDPSHVKKESMPARWGEQWVVYQYDALGRIHSITQPAWDIDGTPTTAQRNTVTYGAANTMTVTLADGSEDSVSQKRTLRYYGKQPRVHTATVGSAVTTIDYDGLARMTQVTNPTPAAGPAVVDGATYDSLGRVVLRSDSNTGTRSFHFDTYGKLAYEIDASGLQTSYGWDPLSRPTSIETSESSVEITYDVASGKGYENTLGRAATASITRTEPFSLGTIAYTFGYDSWGHETSQDITIAGQTLSFDLGFDPQGRLSTRTFPRVSGSRPQAKFQYWESYGGLEGVDYLTDRNDPRTANNWLRLSDYNAFGQPGTAEYGNGADEAWAYFRNGLLSAHTVTQADGGSLIDERYGWNEANNIETVLDCNYSTQSPCPSGAVGDSPWGDRGAQYGYDQLRLSSIEDAIGQTLYCYDDAGNLIQSGDVVFGYQGNQVTTGNTALTPSQCQSAQGDAVFAASYDDDGFMESRTADATTLGLTASVRGWLLQTTLDDTLFERFAYDYSGRRIVRQVFEKDGKTVDYVVLYPAPDVEIKMTHGGTAEYTGYLIDTGGKFAALTEGLPAGDVEQMAEAFGVTLDSGAPLAPSRGLVLHLDQVGNTEAVTEASGEGYATVFYDAWGKPEINPPQNDAFRPLFGGKEYTAETGLYYFDSRYLDTSTGRFVSADTRVAAGPLVSDSFNDYAYALNNPILYSDPSGHAPVIKAAEDALLVTASVVTDNPELDVMVLDDLGWIAEDAADDAAVDQVMQQEPAAASDPPQSGDNPSLASSASRSADSQSGGAGGDRSDSLATKVKKHGRKLLVPIAHYEAGYSAEYTATHLHRDWSWKGFGLTGAMAALDGVVSFGLGSAEDAVGGEHSGSGERQLILTLIRGPIQGATIADMNRGLTSLYSPHYSNSWLVTSSVGSDSGLLSGIGAFGAKKVLNEFFGGNAR